MTLVATLGILAFGLMWVIAATGPLGDWGTDAAVGSIVVVTGLALVLTVPTATAVIMWLYRCCRNLPALGAQELNYGTPGWAVGSWLLPYIGMIMPGLVIREVWRASDPATPISTTESRRGATGPVMAWWLTYVSAAHLIGAALVLTLVALGAPAGPFLAIGVAGALGCISAVASACLGIFVVVGLTRRQEEKHRLVAIAR